MRSLEEIQKVIPEGTVEHIEKDEIIYSRFLKERNEKDLRLLLERYSESLTLFLYGYVHNMEDAEELMMDSFATVAAGKSIFAGRSSFKTWLYSIGHNLALMHNRKHRVRTVPLEEGILPDSLTEDLSELTMMEEERNLRLYRAMEELNPDYKQVMYLIYFEEMTTDEICRVMNKNKKQIYNLSERGRKALREKLSDIT